MWTALAGSSDSGRVKRALALILLFAPAAARAQELSAPPTPHVADPEAEPPPPEPAPAPVCPPALPPGQTHDGAYLRLQAGGGYMTARRNNDKWSGDAITLGAAIGATLVPNLALFGTVLVHQVRGPKADSYGFSTTVNGVFQSESFGAGMAYYIETANVYAAAAVLATSVEVMDAGGGNQGSANRGPAFEVMLGKEWWVGREWGLGLAADVTGASMSDTNDHSVRWNSYTYSLLFSATYN